MLRALSGQLAGPSGRGIMQHLAAGTHCAAAVNASIEAFNCIEFTGLVAKRWATKKQGGSTKNKADSRPKHLGVRMFDGEVSFPGMVVVRQRGTRFKPGLNVGMGNDHTLFSKTVGFVKHRRERQQLPGRPLQHVRFIDVQPLNNDWGQGYRAKVEEMVEARRLFKARMLRPQRRVRTLDGDDHGEGLAAVRLAAAAASITGSTAEVQHMQP